MIFPLLRDSLDLYRETPPEPRLHLGQGIGFSAISAGEAPVTKAVSLFRPVTGNTGIEKREHLSPVPDDKEIDAFPLGVVGEKTRSIGQKGCGIDDHFRPRHRGGRVCGLSGTGDEECEEAKKGSERPLHR